MEVACFYHNRGAQARLVRDSLNRLAGVQAIALDPGSGGVPVSMDLGGTVVDGRAAGRFDVAYTHGFGYERPVTPPECPGVDRSVWRDDHVVEVQRAAFVHGLFENMERRGMTVVNPPRVWFAVFLLPVLLDRVEAAGVKVLKRVCTNDLELADGFASEAGRTVWRPVTGRAAWQVHVRGRDVRRFGPGRPPILLAEAPPGSLVRIWTYLGRPLLCVSYRSPDVGPPERLETVRELDPGPYVRFCEDFHEAASIPWSLLSLVDGKDGQWLADVDADPDFSWLPGSYRDILCLRFARALAGLEIRDTGSLLPEAARPVPAQRSALRMLYALERAKNHGA
ncbi:MAG: hypothetical protein ACLFOY_12620 [Desulfatibacillaceae bacterium]